VIYNKLFFSSNVGKNGYEIDHEDEYLKLKKGPILLNVLLNNLEPNKTLYQICVNMTSGKYYFIVKLWIYEKGLPNFLSLLTLLVIK
jgi:hypothetical protein